jgi:hypothetical protein
VKRSTEIAFDRKPVMSYEQWKKNDGENAILVLVQVAFLVLLQLFTNAAAFFHLELPHFFSIVRAGHR